MNFDQQWKEHVEIARLVGSDKIPSITREQLITEGVITPRRPGWIHWWPDGTLTQYRTPEEELAAKMGDLARWSDSVGLYA